MFDYVLIDCPAGIEQGFRNAIAGQTKAIVVTTPEVSAIRDADRIIGLLEKDGINPIYLLINKLRPDLIRKGEMMSGQDVKEILNSDVIGCINDDVNLVMATNQGASVVNMNTSSGKARKKRAGQIHGTYPLYEQEEHKFQLMFLKQLFGTGGPR